MTAGVEAGKKNHEWGTVFILAQRRGGAERGVENHEWGTVFVLVQRRRGGEKLRRWYRFYLSSECDRTIKRRHFE